MLPRPAWTACMQEVVVRTGIDKKKTLEGGGKGHRSCAPSVTPTPSRSKPTARPVLHKNGAARRLFGASRRLARARHFLPGCPRAREGKQAKSCLAQESHFTLLSRNKSCPLGEKRYRKDWKFTFSVPKATVGQRVMSALISKG